MTTSPGSPRKPPPIAALPVLAGLVAVGTVFGGWWAVPLVGFASGVLGRIARPVLTAGVAGVLGWGALLGWLALAGPLGELAWLLGGVMHLPGVAVGAATLGLAALLAGAAAAVGAEVRFGVSGRRGAASRVPGLGQSGERPGGLVS